jgi:hypothetical protein
VYDFLKANPTSGAATQLVGEILWQVTSTTKPVDKDLLKLFKEKGCSLLSEDCVSNPDDCIRDLRIEDLIEKNQDYDLYPEHYKLLRTDPDYYAKNEELGFPKVGSESWILLVHNFHNKSSNIEDVNNGPPLSTVNRLCSNSIAVTNQNNPIMTVGISGLSFQVQMPSGIFINTTTNIYMEISSGLANLNTPCATPNVNYVQCLIGQSINNAMSNIQNALLGNALPVGVSGLQILNEFNISGINEAFTNELAREIKRAITPFSTGSGQSVNTISIKNVQNISSQFLQNLVLKGTTFNQMTTGQSCN